MIPRLNIGFSLRRQCQYWFGRHPYSPQQGEYLLNHARSGIVMLLRTALPHGGRVGMMVYNCHTVMNAIVQAGCQPVFVDVQGDLRIDLDSLRKVATSIDSLIVSHLFGIRNDIELIREMCPNIIIIEDCAHGWGIEMSKFADAAVYSINQGKFPSIGEGGILKVQPQWQETMDARYKIVPSYSCLQSMKLFVMMQIKALLYFPIIYTNFTLPVLKKNKGNINIHQPIILKKMSSGVQRILGAYYPLIKTEMQKQRLNVKQWQKQLQKCPYIIDVKSGENAFMAVCDCCDVDKGKQWLQKLGIETETHFKHCLDWASSFGYTKGQCPTAEQLTMKLLMIPTYKIFNYVSL